MILEQELWSWVGKVGVGIGLHLLWVGNTFIHSTVRLPAASLASVEVTLTFKNLGQINKQTNKQTDSGVCRVPPELKIHTLVQKT